MACQLRPCSRSPHCEPPPTAGLVLLRQPPRVCRHLAGAPECSDVNLETSSDEGDDVGFLFASVVNIERLTNGTGHLALQAR